LQQLTRVRLDVSTCRDEEDDELGTVDVGGFAERTKDEVAFGFEVAVLAKR
jgi:hypothetical protein